jgi:hypothetical protein
MAASPMMTPMITTHMTEEAYEGKSCGEDFCRKPPKDAVIKTSPIALPFGQTIPKWQPSEDIDPMTNELIVTASLRQPKADYKLYELFALRTHLEPLLNKLSSKYSLNFNQYPTNQGVPVDREQLIFEYQQNTADKMSLYAEVYVNGEPAKIPNKHIALITQEIDRYLYGDLNGWCLLIDPKLLSENSHYYPLAKKRALSSISWILSMLSVIDYQAIVKVNTTTVFNWSDVKEIDNVNPEFKIINNKLYVKIPPQVDYIKRYDKYLSRIISQLAMMYKLGCIKYNLQSDTKFITGNRLVKVEWSSTGSDIYFSNSDVNGKRDVYHISRAYLGLPIKDIKVPKSKNFKSIKISTTNNVYLKGIIGILEMLSSSNVTRDDITVKENQNGTRYGIRGPIVLTFDNHKNLDLNMLEYELNKLIGYEPVTNNPLIFIGDDPTLYDIEYRGLALRKINNGISSLIDVISLVNDTITIKSREGVFAIVNNNNLSDIIALSTAFGISIVKILELSTQNMIYLQSKYFGKRWFLDSLNDYRTIKGCMVSLSYGDIRKLIVIDSYNTLILQKPKGYRIDRMW